MLRQRQSSKPAVAAPDFGRQRSRSWRTYTGRWEELVVASVLPHHPPLLWDITRSVPVGVLLADDEGGVVDSNRAWAQLSGLAPEASLGRGWLDALAKGDR